MSGYAFMVAVGDAIAAACERIEQDDPEAFHYRGCDLRYAAERALFVRLSNSAPLRAAFGGGPPPELASPLEAAVASELPGTGDASHPEPASRLRMAAAGVAGRARRPPGVELPDRRGGTWFLVDHAKFLRFIDPIAGSRSGVVSLDPVATGELARDDSLPFVALDQGQGARAPAVRGLGHALRSLPDLAVDLDRYMRVLGELRPERVVVIEGNAPTDEVMNRAAQALGIECACLQQGWSPVIHPGFRNMTYSAMSVWGDGFAELLAPHNPRQEFAVTGSHMLEAAAADGRFGERIAGRPAAGFFLQGTSPVIEQEHLDAMRELAARVADELPEAAVVVREHPGAPLGEADRDDLARRPNVVWAPAADVGLRTVLEAVGVTVSIYSTTLLESAALGTPPVIFGVTSMERYSPDLDELGAGLQATGVDDALAAIRGLLTDPARRERFEPGMRAVRDRFFAGLDGNAAERVAAVAHGT